MGIRFSCPACGHGLNVKADLAGKRGRCPHCQAKIVIPTEETQAAGVAASVGAAPASASGAGTGAPSGPPVTKAEIATSEPATSAPAAKDTSKSTAATDAASAMASPAPSAAASAPAVTPSATPFSAAAPAEPATTDPISEAPQQQWYVMPPGASNQYGPAAGEEFRAWLQEGRVTADSLVWRQDWPEWKPAGGVFSQLLAATSGEVPSVAGPAMPAASGVPLPNAGPGALPMAMGLPPVAPMAIPAGGMAPGFVPPGGAEIPGFLVTPAEPSMSAAKRSGRPYRARSSTGPMVAIIVLVVLMIPLSYLVIRVLSKQLVSGPPPAASSKPAEE